MRILIPTADYPPIEGGISSVTLYLSRELAQCGHDVTVIAPHYPDMEAFDMAEPVHVIRYRGYQLGPLRVIPMLAAAWRRMPKTDLILAINVASSGVVAHAAQRRYGIPYVTFAYAYEFLKFETNPLVAALLRAIYAHAQSIIAISQFTHDKLEAFGAPSERLHVAFPGAPHAKVLGAEMIAEIKRRFVLDTPHVLLAVGRFMPRKGHATLVRALPKILETFPDTVLVLVGRGPKLQETIWLAQQLGVREHVLFPGRLSDEEVAGLYQCCEIFALPTGEGPCGQVEGFGLVFAEAHAYGKPVVAGRSGGVVDAVLDGETGLLVEPENPEQLAEAILRLMHDPAWAQQLGEVGRRRVEAELNWKQFATKVMESVGISE